MGIANLDLGDGEPELETATATTGTDMTAGTGSDVGSESLKESGYFTADETEDEIVDSEKEKEDGGSHESLNLRNRRQNAAVDETDPRTTIYRTISVCEFHVRDSVLVESFRSALRGLPVGRLKDAVVLDLTRSYGVLSCYAIMEGARKVIVQASSEYAEETAALITRAGFAEHATVVGGPLQATGLPNPKVRTRTLPFLCHVRGLPSYPSLKSCCVRPQVDIILSDWMGDCLFSNSDLCSLIYARDHYLADGGLILPDRVELFITAIKAEQEKREAIEFWSESIYGFDFSAARQVRKVENRLHHIVRPYPTL